MAITPEENGWTVEAVGSKLRNGHRHDFDLPATDLAAADGLQHALAAAKYMLARMTADFPAATR